MFRTSFDGVWGLKKKNQPSKLVNVRSQQLWIPKIMPGGENVKIKKRYHYLEPPPGH
jgi:hypothetical protein